MRSVMVILVVLLAGGRVAHADDKAAAEALFVKAKKLMKNGASAEACDAFARSQELDPQNGTNYNLALCYEGIGRTASAWLIFRDLAQIDTNAKRKKDSTQRAEKLEGKVPQLLVKAPKGVTVTRDGKDVTKLLGVEDPIDPGTYHLEASAPGYVTWTSEVEVKSGVVTVEVPALEKTAPDDQPPPPDDHPPPPPDEHDIKLDTGPHSERSAGKFYGGIGLGVAGVAGIGVGLVFGAKASSKWSEVEDLCGSDLACDNQADLDRANTLTADAKSAANLSTIAVGVGVVAAAVGTYLILTSSHTVVAPTGDGEMVGFVAAGRF